jgi:ubiquinone/menaquinone biosynthesis C-methylase UbiE
MRWDELTHKTERLYRFRQKIMTTLRKIAFHSPWFNQRVVHDHFQQTSRILDEYLAGASLLEVGCGPSKVAAAYQLRSYVGIDASFGMVEAAAKKNEPQHKFLVGDARKLPIRSGSFDVVFANHLYHHVPLADRAEALREAVRVARKVVIIQDTYGFSASLIGSAYKLYYETVDGSYYRMTLPEWQSFFEDCETKVVAHSNPGIKTIAPRVAIWAVAGSRS